MKNDLIYLKHIVDAIEKVDGYLGIIKFGDFEKNDLVINATIRQDVKVVWETSKKDLPELKEELLKILE